MMRRRVIAVIAGAGVVLGLGLGLAGCKGTGSGSGTGSGTGTGSGSGSLAADRWHADLALVGRELPARHHDPFFATPEPQFRAALDALVARSSTLTDDQVGVQLAQLVASLGDSHTGVVESDPARYPIRLYWFDDGLFVIGAPPDALWAVGGQVLAIGGRPVDEALALAATVAAHDNRSQRRGDAAGVLTRPVMVRGLGLADAAGALPLSIAVGGETRPLVVTASGARPSAPRAALPLARRALQQAYWSEYLPDARALFIQYNACREATPPFADFVAAQAQRLATQPVERVVIDLRYNPGGNSEIIRPLLALLTGGRDGDRPLAGRVFVLIGRATFSSAVLNALALEAAGALLIGEIAGGAPSHHGEVQHLALPDHGYRISYSTKFFADPRHPGAELPPTVAVPVRAADFFAGRDPALDAALAAPVGGAGAPPV